MRDFRELNQQINEIKRMLNSFIQKLTAQVAIFSYFLRLFAILKKPLISGHIYEQYYSTHSLGMQIIIGSDKSSLNL